MPKSNKEMEEEKFITILTFTYAYEVAVIRGMLESEGITCFVQDELTVQINPFYSNAIGGVKLQVRASDLNQAIESLRETDYIKKGEYSQPFNESLYVNKYSNNQQISAKESEINCPICGSEEVTTTKKLGWFFLFPSLLLVFPTPFLWFFLLTSLLFVFPTPFFRKKYYCFDCKQEFKLKR